jgi:hypothetical protein
VAVFHLVKAAWRQAGILRAAYQTGTVFTYGARFAFAARIAMDAAAVDVCLVSVFGSIDAIHLGRILLTSA